MAPTERSICRATISSAWPSATMQTSVPDSSTCSRLDSCRKRGSRSAMAAAMHQQHRHQLDLAGGEQRREHARPRRGSRWRLLAHEPTAPLASALGGNAFAAASNNCFAVERRALDPRGDAAAAKHHDAVGHAHQLDGVVADHDDRHALGGQLRDGAVDLRLGADIDAACRLVEDDAASDWASAIWPAAPFAGCRPTACRSPARCRTRRRACAWRYSPAISASRLRSMRPSRPHRLRSTGKVALARIGKGSIRPCLWRSSGTSEMPCRIAWRGEPTLTSLPSSSTRPVSGFTSPNSMLAISDRPAPTSPKKPRISPERTSKSTSLDETGAAQAAHAEHRCRRYWLPAWERRIPSLVPIMARTTVSGVNFGVSSVTTCRPERSTVTSSLKSMISSMKWVMNITATPCRFSVRDKLEQADRLHCPTARRSARRGPARGRRTPARAPPRSPAAPRR